MKVSYSGQANLMISAYKFRKYSSIGHLRKKYCRISIAYTKDNCLIKVHLALEIANTP